MLYVKMTEGDHVTFYQIETPCYVRRQSNGVLVSCPRGNLAQGVVSSDGNEIWQLSGRESLGEGFPPVQEITMAEYDEWVMGQSGQEEPDPEDTDPVIPEDTDPETVLTRAELTEKVYELDEALQLLLSGEVEA